MTPQPNEFRQPTEAERAILLRLLSTEFSGRPELLRQAEDLLVRTIDDDGCLALRTAVTTPAQLRLRVPVEASFIDRDGTEGHVLLHVVGGLLRELEFFKDDGSPVIERPTASALEITVNES